MTTNEAFNQYVRRRQIEHGAKFDGASLAPKFAEHFNNKVKVRFSCGAVKTGYVRGTTGWRPSLMLLLRRTSRGSSWLLSDKDELLQVFPYQRLD